MAQQQIITKPYVGELQDDDSLFINHDGALRQVKKRDADFASSEYVRTYVDNATVASAQKATNDSDGNSINTTYRKVADSYNKSEIDTKLTGKADKATSLSGYGITDGVTKGELNTATVASARNATNATNATNDADGNSIKDTYRKITDSYNKSEIDTKLSGYGITDSYNKSEIDTKLTGKADKATSLSGYGITDGVTKDELNTAINGFKKITWSTITIATSAWSNKQATVSVSGVTASNAVDVAPVEPTFDAYINAGIRATSQGSGKLTFACKTVPTVAISVNVKVYN